MLVPRSRGSKASRRPSPSWLKDKTVMTMATPGKTTRCHLGISMEAASPSMLPQRGLQHNGDAEGRCDENQVSPYTLGRDVKEDDSPGGGPEAPGGFDVWNVPHGQGLGPDDTGALGHSGGGDGQDDGPRTRSKGRGEHQGQGDRGEGQQHLDQPPA